MGKKKKIKGSIGPVIFSLTDEVQFNDNKRQMMRFETVLSIHPEASKEDLFKIYIEAIKQFKKKCDKIIGQMANEEYFRLMWESNKRANYSAAIMDIV